ncbi:MULTISPECIES: tRNA (guanosine(46)-N7)-methyltransferase TrmB [Mesotoga]|jgi:tRNA (guanine-N7-)-methyltransferase|uniref:tRNA (guanosine(46)-N7)-methyltransferase TrmB n=1 Tax=Mesotoga TaxID=1184396 RepID=UPI0002C9F17B|nr:MULTISPECIES: tRNA (guanosine(46)-N7)-methyltransferase TrmB [Mesotoga]MCP5456546.1 tRNA (guanosine(46)-N7)-methyltransferase TrmB [Thermotogota bacterium]CCU85811.1 tRNA (guanine-N(7)-)-methyltransferase [Mesotoga infera]MCP5460507.1 tRNA (guanosine(46)-N7)-methyltransferase TrmB [Thermotogota bacterium]MDK2943332.1 tRNA (guanine-N7-)-methyltransferase [Mesotoga sp.]RLL88422.1 tRNA (guanine-N7)-methyltransferase [Mesotoga sp. H07pep.5.4]
MSEYYLRNYVDCTEYKLPLDLQDVFGRKRETFLEIGFGSGEFILQKAIENPNADYLGVELSMISAKKLLKSLSRNHVGNVRALLVDASFALRNILPKDSMSGVYMNFPCPWPKKRHSERRLNSVNFLEKIAKVLKKGGFFQLYSDSKEFVHEMFGEVGKTNCFDDPVLEVNPTVGVGTRYEKKWLDMSKEIFRMKCIRIKCEINGEEDVVRVSNLWIDDIDEKSLQKVDGKSFSKNEIFVKFMGLYRNMDRNTFLIETLTVDRDFSQRFYINLSRRGNRWLIKLDSQARPFRTKAVKFALRVLSEKIAKKDPGGDENH